MNGKALITIFNNGTFTREISQRNIEEMIVALLLVPVTKEIHVCETLHWKKQCNVRYTGNYGFEITAA